MVGKKHWTANFVFGVSSVPVLPAHPHPPVFLSLSLQPCSPVSPPTTTTIQIGCLYTCLGPHGNHTLNGRKAGDHSLSSHSTAPLPCLVSLRPRARVCLFGCPGHPGMGWAWIPGLSPSWSFFLSRVTLSEELRQD